jgi:hypothetical protein
MKCTEKKRESHAMTAENIRLLIAGIGYSLAELSSCMGIPYRTLQDYYYGKRSIPAEFCDRLRSEAAKIIQIRNEVFAVIDAEAAKVPLIITQTED